jgi:UDP-galactopyranose mutase
MKARIVGCGLSGAVAARLLADKNFDVIVYETRNHIAGNCYDSNVNGTMVHNYGPHIFHTDDKQVYEFLSQFTEWMPFNYKPKGVTKLGVISLPYSKKTISELGRELTQDEIVDCIFKDYSEKQWGVSFEQIPKSITNRIPKTKECNDPTWFEGQEFQCVPKDGYTKMFEKMLNGIEVKLNCNVDDWKKIDADITIYTGKIDEYFNFCYGMLPYRSLQFKHMTSDVKFECVAYNQNTKAVDFTRTYDHSYFTFNHKGSTIITEEYPEAYNGANIPFYPIPWGDSLQMYAKYRDLADAETNIIFLGRLATYTYLDMWMAVKQAMLKLKHINK